MADILRSRRRRGVGDLHDSEEDVYSDSDLSLSSHDDDDDDINSDDSAEETSDYETESDEYEETETDEDYEEETRSEQEAHEQPFSREMKESEPKVPERSSNTNHPKSPLVENEQRSNVITATTAAAEKAVVETHTEEKLHAIDNDNTDHSINNSTNSTITQLEEEKMDIPAEKENQQEETTMIKEQNEEEKEEKVNSKEVGKEHGQEVEEEREVVDYQQLEQPEDIQEKRVQEHREYRRKLAEDPSFVPYVGLFWSHDDRYREDSLTETRSTPLFASKTSQHNTSYDQRMDPLMNKKWDHSGYEELLRLDQEDEKHKQNHEQSEQDYEPAARYNNRQHHAPNNNSKPPPDRKRQYTNNNNNGGYQQKEEWPILGNENDATPEKTDVANASWATVTMDDLQEHDRSSATKKSNRNNHKSPYANGDSNQPNHKPYNNYERKGQSPYRENNNNRYKPFNSRNNRDDSPRENQRNYNKSSEFSKPQKADGLAGWGESSTSDWNLKPEWINNSADTSDLSKVEWDDKSKEPSSSCSEPVSNENQTSGWGDAPNTVTETTVKSEVAASGWGEQVPPLNQNGSGWDSISDTTVENTSKNVENTPVAKNTGTGWDTDGSTTNKNTGTGWSNTQANENAGNNWGNISSTDNNNTDLEWNKQTTNATETTSNNRWTNESSSNKETQSGWSSYKPAVDQNTPIVDKNNSDRSRNYNNRSNNNNWRNKNNTYQQNQKSGWTNLRKESNNNWRETATSNTSERESHSEKASSGWQQPATNIDHDSSSDTASGWGDLSKINNSEKSTGWNEPVTTNIISTPKTIEATDLGDTSVTDKSSNGWSNPSTTTTANTITDETSEWDTPPVTVNKEQVAGWGEPSKTAKTKDALGWNTSATAVDNENTLGWNKPVATQDTENGSGWDKLNTVVDARNSSKPDNSGWNTTSVIAEREVKVLEEPKLNNNIKNIDLDNTVQKESTNGWKENGNNGNSPSSSWTPNLNWGTRNESSARKSRGYLSQKTEAPVIKAEAIELPVETSINSGVHDMYDEEDSDVEIILEDDDADKSRSEQVLGISAPERPTVTRHEPWEKKTPSYNITNSSDYSQHPPGVPMYYPPHMHPNGAMAYVPMLPNGSNSSPMFVPYSMGMPTPPALGTPSPKNSHSGGVSPRKYYSPIPGPSMLQPPPGYEANGMVYYGVDPSAMYAPQQYYYYHPPALSSGGEHREEEEEEGDGWGPEPEAPEKEEEWSKEPYSQHPSNMNYTQPYYYYYQQ